MEPNANVWRRCSNCKNPIALGARHWVCSVSSCSKVRAPTQFCSPDCWAVHEEISVHKNAWAVEQVSPRLAEPSERVEAPRPVEAPARPTAPLPAAAQPAVSAENGAEVLVVVSRLKELIKTESNGMSTSDQVIAPLSDHVRKLADKGIESARQHGRKTMLDRDIPTVGPRASMDVLVVVSKLKDYVRQRADLRTSDDVPAAISSELRRVALFAIESARKDGRKTVMGRDVPHP